VQEPVSMPFPAVFFVTKSIFSVPLGREVMVSILLPQGYVPTERYPLVLFNDGQDFGALGLEETLNGLTGENTIRPMVIAGIHANHDRIHEYGTARQADYAGRGSKAAATTDFVLTELLPFLEKEYNIIQTGVTYAGFSLGGLMALDIVWNHSRNFSAAGIFSGALWWRQKALSEGYDDSDRIMHNQIRQSEVAPPLKFWFQCGSLDEHDDRDGDGVIDSIQDTLECIGELEKKGYSWDKDVFYTEVADGRHNTETWAKVLPAFLKWVSDNNR
jgi:enterochelin esterase-like enzyme